MRKMKNGARKKINIRRKRERRYPP